MYGMPGNGKYAEYQSDTDQVDSQKAISENAGGATPAAVVSALNNASPLQKRTAGLPTASILDFYMGGTPGLGADDTASFSRAVAETALCALDLPKGDYIINNPSGGLAVENYSGKIGGRGKLRFSNPANTGISWNYCHGLHLAEFRSEYIDARTTRNEATMIVVRFCNDVQIDAMTLRNGNAAALLTLECANMEIGRICMDGFKANGLMVVNAGGLTIGQLIARNVEDGALELSCFDGKSVITECSDITVGSINVKNADIGLLINSARRVNVGNCKIDRTRYNGIQIIQDLNTTTTQWPDDISIGNSVITNVGAIGNTADQEAIAVYMMTEPTEDTRVSFGNTSIRGATGDGVSVHNWSARTYADLGDMSVRDVGGVGYRLGGKRISFGKLTAERTQGLGVFGTGGGSLIGDRITVENAQLARASSTAVHLGDFAFTDVASVHIADDQSTPSAWVMSDAGSGKGRVGRVTSNITNGALSIAHTAPGMVYGTTDIGGAIPVTVKKTITYQDPMFRNNWSPQEPVLIALPAGAVVTGTRIKHSTSFTDGSGALTAVAVSIGTDAQQTYFSAALQVGENAAPGNAAYIDTTQYKALSAGAATVYAIFAFTGRAPGDGTNTFLTGGSVDIWITYLVLP